MRASTRSIAMHSALPAVSIHSSMLVPKSARSGTARPRLRCRDDATQRAHRSFTNRFRIGHASTRASDQRRTDEDDSKGSVATVRVRVRVRVRVVIAVSNLERNSLFARLVRFKACTVRALVASHVSIVTPPNLSLCHERARCAVARARDRNAARSQQRDRTACKHKAER
jgi:hypothetical protein